MPSGPEPTDPADGRDPGRLWGELTGRLEELFDTVMDGRPSGDQHDAEGLRYLLRYLAAGISTCVEYDDTTHPELGCLIENRRSWGLDNPDTKYSFTRLEPGATYRVTGDPGSALELELQVDSGHFADGRFTEWKCLGRWRRGDSSLPLDESGSLALEFAAPARSSYLHVREYFGDWSGERPALLAVERLDAPLPPEPLAMADMARRMDLLGEWLTAGARCWADLGAGLASGGTDGITPFVPPAEATGLGGQAYGMGGYHCGANDALVLEFEPPPCRYWSVSLATWFWESPDIANTQCSLNHTQALAEQDDTVRILLCHEDPGVANWLDPSGHEEGTLAFRLLDAAELPTLEIERMPLERAVAEVVPTMEPCGTEQRRRVLARRRNDVVRRYRR